VAITLLQQAVLLAALTSQGLAIDLLRTSGSPDAPPVQWRLGLEPPESWSLLTTLVMLALVFLAASLVGAATRYGQRLADEHFVQSCVVDLRVRLYDRLQRMGCTYFDRYDTGEIVQRLTADAQRVRTFMQTVMVRMLVTIASFAVFLTFMLTEHVGLTIAAVALLPVQVIVMIRYGRKSTPAHLTTSRLLDRFVHHFQESILGSRVVRSFDREGARIEGADERARRVWEWGVLVDRIRSTHVPVVFSTTLGGSAIVLAYGGYLVILGPEAGGVALGTFWVFRGLLDRLSAQAEAISMMAASLPDALAGAERVFQLLDDPESETDRADALAPETRIAGAVTFDRVSFAYEADEPVLRDVSFHVEPGQTVAIVGPTGSGKSTLLSLICRFYDPSSGRVLIDGEDARRWPRGTLRRRVAMVFQEPFLFSNTIGRNVSYGAPGSTRDAVSRAIAAASASDVVERREGGLDTVIGERGVSLSGGQRQRLTLARALMMDAPILVLDDATGSVDPITEAEIQEALDDRLEGRTTFVVAHRLSTLRRADVIIVLERGRVVDVGTHHELLEREGHYRAAALIQLALKEGEQRQAQEGAT
jgi:ABC-type multidrug transport system fused ATPase/permease subunit